MFKMWKKIVHIVDNLFENIQQIYVGYKNLIQHRLGMFKEEDTLEYKRKKKLCNADCPLQSTIFGVAYCNPKKEFNGEYGCGCIIEAKLWSDSPCPLDKF